MNISNQALRIYLKTTAWFTAILLSLAYVFIPIAESVADLNQKESAVSGEGILFTSEIEKSYINVLLVGLDKDETRTDVMMIAQFNLTDNSISILQIPRDTYIDTDRADKKLNSAYCHGGIKTTIKEIQTIVDLDIDKHVTITLEGFRDVIDAVGGVWYDVPQDMDYDDDYQDLHIHLKKGFQLLDGDKAEQYVRCRNIYANADLGRIEAQSGFIEEAIRQIIERCNSGEADTENLIAAVAEMVDTDFGTVEMLKYAPYLLKLDTDKINIMMIEGEAKYIGRISYFIADDKANERIVREYFTPEISQADLSEIRARDEAIGTSTLEYMIDENVLPDDVIPHGITVYVLDYSGTNGAALNETVALLESLGCEIVGSNVAQTTIADRTYCVSDADTVLGPMIANAMGLDTYFVNPDYSGSAQVTIVLGKEE